MVESSETAMRSPGEVERLGALRFVNFGLRTKTEAYLLLADDERNEVVVALSQAQLVRLIAKAGAVLQDMDHEPRPSTGSEASW